MTARRAARADAGLTLLEVMVALALFALIAGAGFSLLDGVLRVRERTDGRLERLADLQRAMHILTADVEQVGSGPVVVLPSGAAFRRASVLEAGDVAVLHRIDGGVWSRTLGEGASARRQVVLTGVSDLRFSFLVRGGGWSLTPPVGADGLPRRPDALAVEVTVQSPDGGLSGPVRRVIRVPAAT